MSFFNKGDIVRWKEYDGTFYFAKIKHIDGIRIAIKVLEIENSNDQAKEGFVLIPPGSKITTDIGHLSLIEEERLKEFVVKRLRKELV